MLSHTMFKDYLHEAEGDPDEYPNIVARVIRKAQYFDEISSSGISKVAASAIIAARIAAGGYVMMFNITEAAGGKFGSIGPTKEQKRDLVELYSAAWAALRACAVVMKYEDMLKLAQTRAEYEGARSADRKERLAYVNVLHYTNIVMGKVDPRYDRLKEIHDEIELNKSLISRGKYKISFREENYNPNGDSKRNDHLEHKLTREYSVLADHRRGRNNNN